MDGLVDILVFLIPCMRIVQVKLIGRLSGADILILVVFFVLLFRLKIRIKTSLGKWMLILCSLWLASQCLTDLVRRSAFSDYARGWSGIGITIACLSVLWTLSYGQPRRIAIYGWGLVVGSFLVFFVTPDEAMNVAPWKFGVARPISLAVFLLVSRREFRGLWPVILGASIGVLNIAMGSRAVGGICLAAALHLLVTGEMRKRSSRNTKIKSGAVAAIAASIILGLPCLVLVYQYAAGHGILGEEAQGRYEMQSSGRFGIVLGGRMDVLGAFFAIYDSPILGHGSWAKDPKYLMAQQQALALMDYNVEDIVSPEELKEGLIPSHSHILGAWVDAGILGAVFWVWIGFMTAKYLVKIHSSTVPLLPLASLAAFQLLWDVLFSGYGAEMRIITPYFFVVVMSCLSVTTPAPGPTLTAKLKRSVEGRPKRLTLNESAQA